MTGGYMSLDIFKLSGKVALVTGGSKGLGKAMARGLAQAGADVVISSRSENELRAALDEVLAPTALEQMGHIDILVNNAGTNEPQAIDKISDESWDRVMEINLNSVMALT